MPKMLRFDICGPHGLFIRKILKSFIQAESDPLEVPPDIEWEGLNHWVMAHNLGPLFNHVLRCQDIPQSYQTSWVTAGMTTMIENLRALKAATRLFDILESSGIKAAAMRGLHLANRIYPETGLRSMQDVDIIIAPEDRRPLLDALKSANLTPQQYLRSQYIYSIEDISFEIHWSLLTAKRYRESISSKELLASRFAWDTPDGRIFCLSNDHEIIGLIAHAFIHHELTIMKQLVDIAMFAVRQSINWDRVYTWCLDVQLTHMFGLTLGLVERLFMLEDGFDRGPFNSQVPPRSPKDYDAYIQPFFGNKGLWQYLRLKRNLIHVAEEPFVKLKQLLRLFTLTEARDIYNRYFKF